MAIFVPDLHSELNRYAGRSGATQLVIVAISKSLVRNCCLVGFGDLVLRY